MLLWTEKKRSEDLVFLAFLLGNLLFPFQGGNQYGARYYYEAYPFMILSVVPRIFAVNYSGVANLIPKILKGVFCLGILTTWVMIPIHMKTTAAIVQERQVLYDQVETEGIEQGLVFLKNGTGILKPMPWWDLLRNGLNFEQEVIYAADLGDQKNKELMEYYSQRIFYHPATEPESIKIQFLAVNRFLLMERGHWSDNHERYFLLLCQR